MRSFFLEKTAIDPYATAQRRKEKTHGFACRTISQFKRVFASLGLCVRLGCAPLIALTACGEELFPWSVKGNELKLEIPLGMGDAILPLDEIGGLDGKLVDKLEAKNWWQRDRPIKVNQRIVVVNQGQQIIVTNGAVAEAPHVVREPDPAGEHVLELTDGSQLHGKLVSFGKSELVWQRSDAAQPLIFSPSDVRRLVLGKAVPAKDTAANATLKFPGGDWITGKVNAFAEGKFAVQIGAGPSVDVAKNAVHWMMLSPSKPPDAFDGPRGPAGMAGWESMIPGSWDYVEDTLIARQSGAITRRFGVLPERLDIQFTANDGGNENRGLTLWIQPEGQTIGYGPGSLYLRFQAGTASLNCYDGNTMKSQTANFEQDKNKRDKISRYRLLYDRKAGKLQVRVNGAVAENWNVPAVKDPNSGGTFSFQPSYWSETLVWTLSGVKVQPWDGDALPDGDPEHVGKEIIKTATVPRKSGILDGLTAEAVKFNGADVSRKEPIFLRFGRRDVEPSAGAIARVWLEHRGEFDVSALGFSDGVLRVRTSFAGDIALPVASLQAVEFPGKPGAPTDETNDTLVFTNGDRLKGSLVTAASDQQLKWKPTKSGGDVQFGTKLLAGVLLGKREDEAPRQKTGSVVARWKNGDWLSGTLVSLDADKLTLKTALSEKTELSRAGLSALYLGPSGEPPVWDGASGREMWMSGAVVPGNWSATRTDKNRPKPPSPWRYFDGAFTLAQVGRNNASNGQNIGRSFETLPDKCEVSFDISAASGDASFVAHFFFDENKPGIMVQSSGDFAYLYDMSPRTGRLNGNQQQQVEFGSAGGGERVARTFTFYCDRLTGRFSMAVNGKLVGQLMRKGTADSPKPGRGISILPQSSNSRVSVSNIWVGPWTGALPPMADKTKTVDGGKQPGFRIGNGVQVEEKKPENKEEPDTKTEAAAEPPKEPESPSDSVALVNGDETHGTVTKATADSLFIEGEIGELEIPAKRATMVQFAALPAPQPSGARFRLAGKGALTVEKFRFENRKAMCESPGAGVFEIPASELSEIVFTPGARSPFETQPSETVKSTGGSSNQIFFQGGNVIRRVIQE